jgi:hydroxylysine kinase
MNDPGIFMKAMMEAPRALSPDRAEALVREHYGIDATAERLSGERDENYRMLVDRAPAYVFKAANAREDTRVSALPLEVMLHVERMDPGIPCPRVVRSKHGESLVRLRDDAGALRTAMLYTHLPGMTLISARRSSAQRANCGRMLARLGQALREFTHPAARRSLIWDLQQLPLLRQLIGEVPDLPNAGFIVNFIARFSEDISLRLARQRQQLIHNDFNARNILVDMEDESRITGVIDFGDSVYTSLIADVAVGVMGQLADPETAQDSIREFVSAYCQVEPLLAEELEMLNWLIAGRIVQNVVITSWHRTRNPAGTHFAGFDAAYFGWRLALAERLVSGPRLSVLP